MTTAKEFANEYYNLKDSGVESVSIKSAIIFAEKYHAIKSNQTPVDVSRCIYDDAIELNSTSE